MQPSKMQVLIVGAGIAGPTLAYWLARDGHGVTLLERAADFRAGGYVIDFWGVGFDVAEQMGLAPELERRGYPVREVRLVGGSGRRIGGFSSAVFGRATAGRYVSLRRGDLACAIYERLDARVERIFGDEVGALEQRSHAVRVQLAHAGERSFDLVIGADGLHSSIRALAFGSDSWLESDSKAQYERYLGYEVAAFEVAGYRPRDEQAYVLYAERGMQVARFAIRNDRTLFLFMYEQAGPEPPPAGLDAQRARLRARFEHGGWECARIVQALEGVDEIYLDRVSQIRMPSWTSGRVALVGDAAYCVSLLAGQGAALAMLGARVLAGELQAAGDDFAVAFRRYEERLRPFMDGKQRNAERIASAFVPHSDLGLHVRTLVSKVLRFGPVADLVIGRSLRDDIALPQYG